jgi:hypothetical protein
VLQAVRNYSQNKPLWLRQKALRRASEISTSLYQVLLYILFAPFGNDSKWIRKVKKETWQGNWIMPAVTPLDQVENTAPDADIIILYIHGKYKSKAFYYFINQSIEIPYKRWWIFNRIFNNAHASL